VLAGSSKRESAVLEAVNRRGRSIECDTTILPLITPDGDGDGVRGAIILMRDGPARDHDGDHG
jgi:hypothetical protein